MNKRKIIFLTDMDFKGSGYYNISVSLMKSLVDLGYEIMAVGLSYGNEEHNYPFGILPARTITEAYATVSNLYLEWKPEAVVVALDIPMQMAIRSLFEKQRLTIPYYGIFPLESPPLSMTWAMPVLQMQGSMCMTHFGTEECHKKGIVSTKYIPIGVDQDVWRFASAEDRTSIRTAFGYTDKDFVVLTVADNQERKNLTASMNIIQKLQKACPDKTIRYNLVTREQLSIGYLLNDYAIETGIIRNMTIFERGLPTEELWRLYVSADAMLLTSKSEGLGMPVLEAMSCGLPVVASNCCAIQEHLQEGFAGYPIKIKIGYRDSFGNGFRYLVDEKDGVNQLLAVMNADEGKQKFIRDNAKQYIASLSYTEAAKVIDTVLSKGA